MSEKILHCGNCHVCCELKHLIVNHFDEDDPNIETYDYYGDRFVRKTDSGSCVYLGKNGCEIYDRRPKTCRDFTCEKFLDGDWSRFGEATQAATLEPLRRAARVMLGRHKSSLAHRFNAALKG